MGQSHSRRFDALSSGFGSLCYSSVKDSSVLAVQIFDQRKFKRRDQGFLGVVNIPVREHLETSVGGQGSSIYIYISSFFPLKLLMILLHLVLRDGHSRPEEIER